MRKLLIIALLILFVTPIISCNSNDDSISTNNISSLLIGKWVNDLDPGYGDPVFYSDGTVEMYYNDKYGDTPFKEKGKWQLKDKILTIIWEDSDPGLEIYEMEIIDISEKKLIWKTFIDGELTTESFTKS